MTVSQALTMALITASVLFVTVTYHTLVQIFWGKHKCPECESDK